MEMQAKNSLFILLLVVFATHLGDGIRISEDSRRSVRSFRQGNVVEIEKPSLLRHKREATSSSDSVQCIRLGGKFEEKTKEEAIIKNFANEVHLSGDNKANLQLAWTGRDYERIIVVTGEFGASSVYISDDSGKKFNNISHVVEAGDEFAELTLQKHNNESSIVYLVANNLRGATSTLYVSLDGASTFQKVPVEFKLDTSMMFHSTKVRLVLVVDEYSKSLYLSEDKGLKWKKIKSNVVAAKWGIGSYVDDIFVITNNNTESFFYDTPDSYGNVFEKSGDYGQNWKQIHTHVYTFGIGGRFLYVSVYKDVFPSSERYLEVSTDGGDTWNNVRLPTITPERFYSILDTSEGQIFLHVDHPGDTGRGTLYTSDATGIIFSESLQNHLYPNYDDLTDFYRVLSMRGVYIASQLMEDDSIHTQITFDRGGEWQPITRPEGASCKDETKTCYLQIHNLYSINRGILADPPLSVPNAVGIILVHGHVAEALQTTPPDVFVSSDGGYTWRLALKGPHHYQIADHGGLLVAVPSDTDTPSIVKFSTDEGRCWISYNFTEKKIVYTGLLIEPGNRDMTVAIWGYTQEDRIWHTHILNFSHIIDRQCGVGDYESWVPHQHNDNNGCLLGQKEVFSRLKADSWCYNGRAYEVTKTSETCPCIADDFDCDYGYNRVGESCVKDTSVTLKEIDICLRGHEERFIPSGYHKIPGDKCSGGFLPAEAKIIDLSDVCSTDSAPAASSNDNSKSQGNYHQAAVVLTAIFAIFSVILIIVLVTYLAKKYKFIRKGPTYRYSSIRCEDDEPNLLPIKHTGTSLFEDTSDEEVPEPIKIIPKGKLPNGQLSISANGHIPNGSTSATLHHSSMKTKLVESDDDMLE